MRVHQIHLRVCPHHRIEALVAKEVIAAERQRFHPQRVFQVSVEVPVIITLERSIERRFRLKLLRRCRPKLFRPKSWDR